MNAYLGYNFDQSFDEQVNFKKINLCNLRETVLKIIILKIWRKRTQRTGRLESAQFGFSFEILMAAATFSDAVMVHLVKL